MRFSQKEPVKNNWSATVNINLKRQLNSYSPDDIFNLMCKDKSRRNIGVDEFQLTSKKFIIHPEYGAEEGVGTHDICLIQTPEYEFGIFEDLSSKFESIPCLPETFDLEKVKKIIQISSPPELENQFE